MEVLDLVELQKKYQDRLQVIGLVVDDADEDAVRKFAKQVPYHPVAMATDVMRIQFGGVPALTTSFIRSSPGFVLRSASEVLDAPAPEPCSFASGTPPQGYTFPPAG